GVTLAAGDVNGDGRDELITGTFRGSSQVKVFDGISGGEVLSEFAFPSVVNGVSVAAGDLNRDGKAEIITGGAVGARGRVKAFSAHTAGINSLARSAGAANGGVKILGARTALVGTNAVHSAARRKIVIVFNHRLE